MKKIFSTTLPDGYEIVQSDFQDGTEFFITQINGEARSENWTPKPVKIVRWDEQNRILREADTSLLNVLSNALVLKRKAIDRLGPFLRDYGELLPLRSPDEELAVFNPTAVIDALDEAGSQVWRFDDGRLMSVRRYAFRPEVLKDIDIFKIPNLRACPVFFSETAVRIWKEAHVTGLDFKEIWRETEGTIRAGGRSNDVTA